MLLYYSYYMVISALLMPCVCFELNSVTIFMVWAAAVHCNRSTGRSIRVVLRFRSISRAFRRVANGNESGARCHANRVTMRHTWLPCNHVSPARRDRIKAGDSIRCVDISDNWTEVYLGNSPRVLCDVITFAVFRILVVECFVDWIFGSSVIWYATVIEMSPYLVSSSLFVQNGSIERSVNESEK